MTGRPYGSAASTTEVTISTRVARSGAGTLHGRITFTASTPRAAAPWTSPMGTLVPIWSLLQNQVKGQQAGSRAPVGEKRGSAGDNARAHEEPIAAKLQKALDSGDSIFEAFHSAEHGAVVDG